LPSDGFLFDLLEPWAVRTLSIRKTADLPLQLWVGTFPRFVAIRFYFHSKPLYRSLHQSFLAHLAFRPCELLSSLFVRRPSVNISHFNLLLRNHWANCNQTLVEWSLDGPLPKMCLVIPTSNQDGRQAKNRKKGG
jgi:hypothetical protein